MWKMCKNFHISFLLKLPFLVRKIVQSKSLQKKSEKSQIYWQDFMGWVRETGLVVGKQLSVMLPPSDYSAPSVSLTYTLISLTKLRYTRQWIFITPGGFSSPVKHLFFYWETGQSQGANLVQQLEPVWNWGNKKEYKRIGCYCRKYKRYIFSF